MIKFLRTMFFASAVCVVGVYSVQAAHHKDVKHCADDYRKYCHQWGLETKGLKVACGSTGQMTMTTLA